MHVLKHYSRSRILLLEKNPIVRRGVSSLIEFEPDLEVCAKTRNLNEALATIRAMQPDLVIIDNIQFGSRRVDLIRHICTMRPAVSTLIISLLNDAKCRRQAMLAGASGFVDKQQLDQHLLPAIRQILSGGTWFSNLQLVSPAEHDRSSASD